MPCPEERLLVGWASGRIPPDIKPSLDEHLDSCERCCRYVASLARPTVTPVATTTPLRGDRKNRRPAGEHAEGPTQVRRAPGPPSDDDRVEPPWAPREAEASAPIGPGSSIGRYLVLREVGAGGMGRVYLAFDPELDRKVAIKLLRTDLRSVSADELRVRLMREAQAMARVSHPNIVNVYDVGTAGSQVFVAMEFITGRTVRQWLKEKPRSWREVLGVFVQAGKGLAAAHAAGVVHRDFKPDNVIIGNDERVRVLDFGLARPAELLSAETAAKGAKELEAGLLDVPLTRSGTIIGTPQYMAPEQFRFEPADARTDEFSFCVALYEGLYGAPPFAGKTVPELLHSVTQGSPLEPPKEVKVPGWVRTVVRRGLSAKRDDRLPSMEALLAALAKDPAVRLRRMIAVAAALAVVAGVFAGLAVYHDRAQTLCRGAQRKLEGGWDDARKQAIQSAFVATGLPFAGGMWAGVEKALDAYAAAWVAKRTDACEATRIRGEQSEELLDLRIECLDRRLQEFAALSDLFSRADAKVVEEAVPAAEALIGLSACDNPRELKAAARLPAGSSIRPAVQDLRSKMAAAKVLGDTGKVAAAVDAAKRLESPARQLNYAPILAEVLLLEGELFEKQGDDRQSRAALNESASTALASREDQLVARSLVESTAVVFHSGHADDALSMGQLAQGAIQRLGGDDKLQARLHHIFGLIFQSQGRYPEALAHLQKCLTLREQAFGPDSLVVAVSASAMASGLSASGQLDAAIAQNERALALREKALGPTHPALAIAYDTLAGAYETKGDLAHALEDRRRALTILESGRGDRDPAVATELESIARLQLARVDSKAAIEAQRRAVAICEKSQGADQPETAEAVRGLADIESAVGQHPQALADYERALQVEVTALGADSPKLAPVLLGVGREQLALGAAKRAIPSLERAVRLQEAAAVPIETLAPARFALAQALWMIPSSHGRALGLAELARQGFARSQQHAADLARVASWLAGHH
jgi:eukaryotic-like serine/threonine-protein kinase